MAAARNGGPRAVAGPGADRIAGARDVLAELGGDFEVLEAAERVEVLREGPWCARAASRRRPFVMATPPRRRRDAAATPP